MQHQRTVEVHIKNDKGIVMDLTKTKTTGNGVSVAVHQHDPAPLRGSSVAASGFPVSFEVFKLQKNGKWGKFDRNIFLDMKAKSIVFSSFAVKAADTYYCGSDTIYKKLVDKGENRGWMHDLIIDNIKNFDEGWLTKSIRELIAI